MITAAFRLLDEERRDATVDRKATMAMVAEQPCPVRREGALIDWTDQQLRQRLVHNSVLRSAGRVVVIPVCHVSHHSAKTIRLHSL